MAGADIMMANDIDKAAMATYRKYKDLLASPDAAIVEQDIATVTTFPDAELLLGCYPCQSFTMGGARTPATDKRTDLYRHFVRAIDTVKPRYFVAENVAGLKWLENGRYLDEQLRTLSSAGSGYILTPHLLDAKDYGLPQSRRRIFIVGVRRDLGLRYEFPRPTHGPKSQSGHPYTSHGDALADLPLDAEGAYYSIGDRSFPWWFMSRNRKRPWDDPAFTVVANWRHITLHPASPTAHMVDSDLANGFRQTWEFTDEYEHLVGHPERPTLSAPRRLSWRECAVLQSFPATFEPEGSVQAKFWQIGNAVPPMLMNSIVRGLVNETALTAESEPTDLKVRPN